MPVLVLWWLVSSMGSAVFSNQLYVPLLRPLISTNISLWVRLINGDYVPEYYFLSFIYVDRLWFLFTA